MKLISWGVVAVATVMLAACSTLTEPMYPGDSRNLGVPGAQIDVTHGVEYYPACGNETLDFGGLRYFPFTPSNADDFPYEGGYIAPETDGFGFAPMVVAPGPGDDVGTLTQYENGFAYWISDNGYLSTWLTDTELTYNWVC